MKVTVNIDCTPAEARAFFGLPDVQPMQASLMKDLEDRLRKNIQAMDPETMFKTWLPATLKNIEQMQEMFLAQLDPTRRKR
ncbi:MAG TPA: DUF6489 family protein [Stellaceae bacterium]|jgi:hypothetical protein|nr:DUF6489 family protein [Stellaceae bacterium]